MTRHELIEEVQAELTGSGMLPKIIKDDEVSRIITSSVRFFSEMYKYATEVQRMLLPKSIFSTEQFKRGRSIVLPDNVLGVHNCQEIGGVGRIIGDEDFSTDKLYASALYVSNVMGNDIVTSIVNQNYASLMGSFVLDTLAYDFNKNTKKLMILGHDPTSDVVLEMDVNIESNKLFNDHYFQRYCIAQTKVAFSRIIGTYNYQLPGGVEINHDAIRTEGESELDEIKEYLESIDLPDWFLYY